MNDRFVRIALAVIAVCQLYGVAKDVVQPAWAQAGPVAVNVEQIGGMTAYLAHPINVRMSR